uniref:Glycoside hydrolase family 28 n=1 Tax=Ramulus artemis TaxID=1390046 RepID=A0A191XT31_9NEOP|nr:glycoside hydrolase family 28 [Ramulus artemis]
MLKLLLIVMSLAVLQTAVAKDLRTVTEPKIPAACTSLTGTGKEETSVIQKALSSCAKGKAVRLASGTFISGPLTIPSGVGLWVDSEATLKASTNPKDYDTGKNLCGALDDTGLNCNPFIIIKDAKGSGIYGKGTIDGQGGHIMTGKNESWWQLAQDALVKDNHQNCPRLIEIVDSEDITLYQITLKDAPKFHVGSATTNGFTAWGVTITAPGTARNTDGIDPIDSRNITIAHCHISTGDDNVAIKAIVKPVSHISILNNVFGTGHGMSIGGGAYSGVTDMTVTSLILDGTTNGLRIKSDKSRGGLVNGVSYTNVCMRNVQNPILLDTHYTTDPGNLTPVYKNISFNNITVLTPGKFTFDGISEAYPVEVTLNNVHIKKGSTWVVSNAKIKGKYSEDASGTHC